MLLLLFFFFFKQKTEYEMRISDWSSDVCSSDLAGQHTARGRRESLHPLRIPPRHRGRRDHLPAAGPVEIWRHHRGLAHRRAGVGLEALDQSPQFRNRPEHGRHDPSPRLDRSEEHTSELQSLMRISYAVFCLK